MALSVSRITLTAALSILFFAGDLKADGRDIKSIRRCPAEETEKAQAVLQVHQNEGTWSPESKQALNLLFECADARFVAEKRLVSDSGEYYSIVSYDLESLGISLQYSSHGFLGLTKLPVKSD